MKTAMAGPPRKSVIVPAFLAVESALKKYLKRYLSRRQDIEDVVQEIFVRAYESERTQEIHHPKSFLFRIAKHVALNEISRASRQMISYVGDSARLDVLEDRRSGEQVLALEQRVAVLNKAIADLPAQCQRVLVMRKIYGYSHKEVAASLNISVKTVEKHLTKGLQRCQQALAEEGKERTGTTGTEEGYPFRASASRKGGGRSTGTGGSDE